MLLASFVLGGATSYGQGVLPHALQPFANSASGWTFLTALLVWSSRGTVALSAVIGAASFVLLVLGYSVVSNLRGYYVDPLFWSVVGVVAGPVVGAAAAALHQEGRAAATAVGVLAGILVGDSTYGLSTVWPSTGRTYWVLVGVGGLVLLGAVAARRLRTVPLTLLAVVSTVVVAGLMEAGYALLNAGVL